MSTQTFTKYGSVISSIGSVLFIFSMALIFFNSNFATWVKWVGIASVAIFTFLLETTVVILINSIITSDNNADVQNQTADEVYKEIDELESMIEKQNQEIQELKEMIKNI